MRAPMSARQFGTSLSFNLRFCNGFATGVDGCAPSTVPSTGIVTAKRQPAEKEEEKEERRRKRMMRRRRRG